MLRDSVREYEYYNTIACQTGFVGVLAIHCQTVAEINTADNIELYLRLEVFIILLFIC